MLGLTANFFRPVFHDIVTLLVDDHSSEIFVACKKNIILHASLNKTLCCRII